MPASNPPLNAFSNPPHLRYMRYPIFFDNLPPPSLKAVLAILGCNATLRPIPVTVYKIPCIKDRHFLGYIKQTYPLAQAAKSSIFLAQVGLLSTTDSSTFVHYAFRLPFPSFPNYCLPTSLTLCSGPYSLPQTEV